MYTMLVFHFDKSTKLVKRMIFSLLSLFFPSFFFFYIFIFTFSAVSIFPPVFLFLYFFRSRIFPFFFFFPSPIVNRILYTADGKKKYKSTAFIIEFFSILFEISPRAPRMTPIKVSR